MFRPLKKESNFLLGQWVNSVLHCIEYLSIDWTPRDMTLEQINAKSVLTGMHIIFSSGLWRREWNGCKAHCLAQPAVTDHAQ